jgi:hypothetical protein
MVMLASEKSPTDVAHRLKIENEKLPLDRQFNSNDLGTFLIAAVTRSPSKKVRQCGEKFEEQQRLGMWKDEVHDLAFVESKLVVLMPKDKVVLPPISPKKLTTADEDEDGPSAIAAGAQQEGKGRSGKGGKGGKGGGNGGKGKGDRGSGGGGGGGRGKVSGTGKGSGTGSKGSGGGHPQTTRTCFICNQPGHGYRDVRSDGTPYHTAQEIFSAREKSSARGNNTSGATGGCWQRSGGAAEESASTDADEAELEVKLLEAQLKAMKAKKRAEGSKDNNRSGGAATDSHHGWE